MRTRPYRQRALPPYYQIPLVSLCYVIINVILVCVSIPTVLAFKGVLITPTSTGVRGDATTGRHRPIAAMRGVTGPFGNYPTNVFNARKSIVRHLSNNSGGDGDDGGDIVDPNPGALNNWNDDGGGDDDEKENLWDSLKLWLKSNEAKEDAQTYTVSLCVALLLRFFIVEPRYIPSLSMYPTFQIGDQLAVEKVTKRIRPYYRNEVVVFNPPPKFQEIVTDSRGKEALIKRIIAIEGDQVQVKNGKLLVNEKAQNEPFTNEDAKYSFGPVVVPTDQLLVFGDNRNQSLDGHIWGFLPEKNVIGRAVFIYWPPWRWGNDGMF